MPNFASLLELEQELLEYCPIPNFASLHELEQELHSNHLIVLESNDVVENLVYRGV